MALSYQDVSNAMHVRQIDFTLQEYLFCIQVVMGENPSVAYASIFDSAEFNRNVPSEDEEEYLEGMAHKAELLQEQHNCKQLIERLSEDYQSEVQAKAISLKDYKFTGSDVQRLLNNLLKERTEDLSEASVRDIVSLIKSMYDSGALDSGDQFQSHFITIPNKYNTVCPSCGREGYAVHGLDFRCESCGAIAKWDESSHRYFPELSHL